MELTFWLSLAFVAYVYAGYPVLLRVWATRRARRRPGADANGRTGLPGVSIVIAARNEAARLGARLDNLRSLDYPPARRQIIVVSDGSTDGTVEVAARYRPFVEFIEVSHGGKALALNAFGIVLMAFVMAHSVAVWHASAWGLSPDKAPHVYGFFGGFFNWLGFVVPMLLNSVAFEKMKWKVFGINAAYQFVSLQVIGMILAFWR